MENGRRNARSTSCFAGRRPSGFRRHRSTRWRRLCRRAVGVGNSLCRCRARIEQWRADNGSRRALQIHRDGLDVMRRKRRIWASTRKFFGAPVPPPKSRTVMSSRAYRRTSGRRPGAGFLLGMGGTLCTMQLAHLGAEVIRVETSQAARYQSRHSALCGQATGTQPRRQLQSMEPGQTEPPTRPLQARSGRNCRQLVTHAIW